MALEKIMNLHKIGVWLFTLVLTLASLPALAQDVPPTLAIRTERASVAPNEVVRGVLTVTFAEGLHAYQNPQEDPAIIPIVLEVPGVELSKVEYPKGEKKIMGGLPDPYYVHGGTIEIPFEFTAPSQVPAEGLVARFSYQQCDKDNCYIPGSVEIALPVKIEGATVASGETETEAPAAGGDATGTEGQAAGGTTTPPPATPSTTTPTQGGLGEFLAGALKNQQWFALVGILLLVGLAINLTPCVYPLIPVTIAFFGGQAKESAAARFALGFFYMLGIAISYGLVGGIAAVTGGIFGQLFTQWWFNALLGLFMVGLALSMFDLYQIGLPPAISSQIKGRSGPVGSLIMGLLVGVGAAPCAGPVIVLLFTEVAKLNNAFLAVLSFVIVGLGLGIPYFLLGLFSDRVKLLPKAGGWMKSVKAIMGLAVIFFGLGYFVLALPSVFTDSVTPWVYVGFFLACAIFLFLWDKASTDRRTWNVKGAGILAFGLLAGVTYANYQSELRVAAVKEEYNKILQSDRGAVSEWQKFTEESFAAAVASGKPIFIDGTADWCAECKVIERTVFSDPRFIGLTQDVVLLKIDWSTGVDPEYREFTRKKFDIKGLPHLVFMKPGGETVSVLNSLHSIEELEAELRKAGAGQ